MLGQRDNAQVLAGRLDGELGHQRRAETGPDRGLDDARVVRAQDDLRLVTERREMRQDTLGAATVLERDQR